MTKASADIKRPWKPTEGIGQAVLVRIQPPELAKVDTWIAKNDPDASRPEAIRQLVALGLKSSRLTRAK